MTPENNDSGEHGFQIVVSKCAASGQTLDIDGLAYMGAHNSERESIHSSLNTLSA